MKHLLLITSMLLSAATDIYGQLKTEYFFDTDPGYGKATSVTTTEGSNAMTLRTSQLAAGIHLLGIRSLDASGQWSPTLTSPIYVFSPKAEVSTAEYFFDTDPGHGNATSVTTAEGSNAMTLRTSQLAAGIHLLGIRSTDTKGQWSPTLTSPIYVFDPMTEVSAAEWFVDTDPGHGKATRVTMAAGSNVMTIPTGELSTGFHLLGVRSCSRSGQWSPTLTSPIYVAGRMGAARAEWFVDTDPGEGKANAIDVSGQPEITFMLPTTELEAGAHSLTVRIMTALGQWLPFTVTPFTVTRNTGIATVESVMTVGISRADGRLVLTCGDNMDGARVEVFTTDGMKRASASWTAGTQETSIDVPQQLSPVIVTVTKADGTRFVRLLK